MLVVVKLTAVGPKPKQVAVVVGFGIESKGVAEGDEKRAVARPVI